MQAKSTISVRKLKEKLGIPIRERKTTIDEVKEEAPPKKEQGLPDPKEFNEATREIL